MNFISLHSTFANDLDRYQMMLTATCVLVALIVIAAIVYFCLKYHWTHKAERVTQGDSLKVEITWTAVTLVIFILFFWKGSSLYKSQVTPKKADYQVFVFGKRWMWKFHHQNGFVEANELHLPAGKTIEFVMTSQDVIHSFYLPEFRIKQDVLPEIMTRIYLHPLKTGGYSLLCAEYCGTSHAKMMSPVTILPEQDYRELIHLDERNSSRGEKLFVNLGCISCHADGSKLAPNLKTVELKDDDFIRESILYPQKQITPGFDNSMPSFKGSISDENIRDLIQYIKKMRTP